MRNLKSPTETVPALLADSEHTWKWLSEQTGIDEETLRAEAQTGTQCLNLEDAAVIADALGVDVPVLIYGSSE